MSVSSPALSALSRNSTPAPGSTVAEHLDAFERILADGLEARPIFFSSMAGNDLWRFAESVEFLTKAHAIVQRYGVRVGFETHRSRTLFHPVMTRELLREVPPIELTIHFVLHVQPRIGYDQGPQVPDPRAPEYASAVEAHFRWWRALWEGQRRRGFQTVTMTPEFGPDGYLHLEPFTQKPVADLWELNCWTGQRLREAFANF